MVEYTGCFLSDRDLRPWRASTRGGFHPIGLALGIGRGALEVAIAQTDRRPAQNAMQSVWRDR